MKTIKIFLCLVGILFFQGCTNWNYIDTGVHDPNEHANSTMYEYLKKRADQFYLTTAIIERAGLTDLFQGKDPNHKNIMFFAPTKYSIAAGMIRKGYAKTTSNDPKDEFNFDLIKDIQEIPVDVCKSIILSYTFDKVCMRDEFKEGKRGPENEKLMQGGEVYTSINGNQLWVYRQQTPYGNFADIHVNTIVGIELETKTDFYLASTDIKVKNGVVHANTDGFIIKDLK